MCSHNPFGCYRNHEIKKKNPKNKGYENLLWVTVATKKAVRKVKSYKATAYDYVYGNL